MSSLPPWSHPKPTLYQAFRAFLEAHKSEYNADLVEHFLSAGADIEVQANPRTDIGEARVDTVPGRKPFKYRVDSNVKFWAIRRPKDSDTTPDWDTMPDPPFDLEKYIADFGTTWFARERSLRVGYDVDSLFGHSKGLSDDELARFDQQVATVDYVENRRSTSGAGRHLYIPLDGIVVANHSEHAAIARAGLGKLCADLGLNFEHNVDCLGSVLWIASRRATLANRGFEKLKSASRVLTPDDLPRNWRDHVDVVKRKRATAVFVAGASDSDEQLYAELSSAQATVKPDDEHRRIFDAYQKTGFTLEHKPDHGCYRAHTAGLAAVHRELALRGVFITNSGGTDPSTPNCHFYLRRDGAMYVVRYGSQSEHPSWTTRTGKGEISTLFNVATDLKSACQAVGGVWGGKFCTVHTVTQAEQLAAMFGFKLPPLLSHRPINFKHGDATTIIVEAQQLRGESPLGWAVGHRKLTCSFAIEAPPTEQHDLDDFARHVVTSEHEDAGWLLKTSDGWNSEAKGNVADALVSRFAYTKPELSAALGKLVENPYTLVNEPFQPEFLPGRRWNKFGAQLAVAPTYGSQHPHYDLIYRHCGRGLDTAVQSDPWCIRHGITDGSQFLRLWSAKKIQHPKVHLPLLSFYSRQHDNGKSAFHKSQAILYRRGCVEGVRTLNENFNKMLIGAVLVYLDEERVEARAAQKVKLYIDADYISARLMRSDTFMVPNFTHWTAAYNFPDGLPIEPGDERIILIEVPELLNDEKLDWKETLLPELEKEASDFLGTLLTMELPPSAGRLYLPVLSTEAKQKICGNADAPSCDRDELLQRVVKVMRTQDSFAGKSGEFLALLGTGSWTTSPNCLRRYLKEITDPLREHGISVEFPTARKLVLEKAA
jgi:hypothetical protein